MILAHSQFIYNTHLVFTDSLDFFSFSFRSFIMPTNVCTYDLFVVTAILGNRQCGFIFDVAQRGNAFGLSIADIY